MVLEIKNTGSTSVPKPSKKIAAKARVVSKKKTNTSIPIIGNDQQLPPEKEARLKELVTQVISIHRKSTAHTFEIGASLAEAKSIQPEKRFTKWLKANIGYTTRSAWNFISVNDQLRDYRKRLEAHSVGTTALFEIAKGDAEQIEAVLHQFDNGRRLRASDIKAMICKKEKIRHDVDPLNIGSKAGLQKMIDAKIKSNVYKFHELTAAVLKDIESAVDRHQNGKRIVMSTLARDVETNARHASNIFLDIAIPLEKLKNDPSHNLCHQKLCQQTGWGAVQHALSLLGGGGSWPLRDEMEKWIVEVGHPALRFAVHGETMPKGKIQPESKTLDVKKTEALNLDVIALPEKEVHVDKVLRMPDQIIHDNVIAISSAASGQNMTT